MMIMAILTRDPAPLERASGGGPDAFVGNSPDMTQPNARHCCRQLSYCVYPAWLAQFVDITACAVAVDGAKDAFAGASVMTHSLLSGCGS
jgi:hypothetical protein